MSSSKGTILLWSASPFLGLEETEYIHFEKEQHAGKQTLYFDWFRPHLRHRFVPNFHYDGTIQRHLGP